MRWRSRLRGEGGAKPQRAPQQSRPSADGPPAPLGHRALACTLLRARGARAGSGPPGRARGPTAGQPAPASLPPAPRWAPRRAGRRAPAGGHGQRGRCPPPGPQRPGRPRRRGSAWSGAAWACHPLSPPPTHAFPPPSAPHRRLRRVGVGARKRLHQRRAARRWGVDPAARPRRLLPAHAPCDYVFLHGEGAKHANAHHALPRHGPGVEKNTHNASTISPCRPNPFRPRSPLRQSLSTTRGRRC